MQVRRRGGSGGSVEPPLKFYSSERTPFEANELKGTDLECHLHLWFNRVRFGD